MLNVSIMQLDVDHIDEVCEDIICQQREGVSTHALFMMRFSPEGTPPTDKAKEECERYEQFRVRLDKAGAKYGVLVQSTMGHVEPPAVKHPFQTVISLVDGSVRESTCCPLDEGFRAYIRSQMHTLAEHKPSIVMIDDDVGLLYRAQRGCACPIHMAEFNRRAKTNMTREELYAHTQGKTEEDRRYTDIYVQLQADAMVGAVEAMRAGVDEVDPTILGAVSGIFTGTFCEFSDRTANAFAGKNNPKIVRINNGMYTKSDARRFTVNMYRAAMIRSYLNGAADILLAETDTCPHNRYATSASMLHAHFTGTILEGAKGAKHWITRLHANEPNAGKAYRKILGKYSKFYEALTAYVDELRPVGCRIPLSRVQDYAFIPSEYGSIVAPWATCVLERMGLPLYFSDEGAGVVFLDDFSVDTFTDAQIEEFFKGTLVLSAVAAKKLTKRGFGAYIGVRVDEWKGKMIRYEDIDGHEVSKQMHAYGLTANSEGVTPLSYAVYRSNTGETETLFPAVAGYENALGGYTVTFCGTPDTPFHYTTAFAMLNESRKKQLIEIVQKQGNLPVYYPDDAEVYLRAGYLKDGTLFCAVFNLGFDVLEEIPLTFEKPVRSVEKLNPDGTRSACAFRVEGNTIVIEEAAGVLLPVILFVS